MQPLKLTALDAEDLAVISAHLQDAILRIGDIRFLPKQATLAVIANRFDWESAASAMTQKGAFERRRSGLQIHRVLSLKRHAIRQDAPDAVLSLLAVLFHPAPDPPGGVIELTFSGGGSLRAEVECIEVALDDLGPAWQTHRKPSHAGVTSEE